MSAISVEPKIKSGCRRDNFRSFALERSSVRLNQSSAIRACQSLLVGKEGRANPRPWELLSKIRSVVGRLEEIILLAPTDNIGGFTYHTALVCLSAGFNGSKVMGQKTISIVDEIGIVAHLQSLSRINNRSKVVRSLPPNSPDLFGGLPMVIKPHLHETRLAYLTWWRDCLFGKNQEKTKWKKSAANKFDADLNKSFS